VKKIPYTYKKTKSSALNNEYLYNNLISTLRPLIFVGMDDLRKKTNNKHLRKKPEKLQKY